MLKLRIAVLFLFAALSMARAQCGDFEILANNSSLGKGNSVSYPVSFANIQQVIFTTNPSNSITEWRANEILLPKGASWTQPLENKDYTITFTVQCEQVIKTIVLDVQAIRHLVAFNTDGGSAINPQTVRYNDKATEPNPPPTKPGYNFDGWNFDFNTSITKDTTITAKWKAKPFTITYNPQGGTVAPASQSIIYKSLVSLPTPTRTGYAFNGWFTAATGGSKFNNGDAYNFTTDITLHAQWTGKTYTISFNPQGGSVNPLSKQVTYGSPVGALPTPIREGYDFEKWSDNYTSATTYLTDGNITLTAIWKIKTYTVAFNTGGGSAVSPQTIEHGSKATEPSATRAGYDFVQWLLNGAKYDFNTPVTGNITLAAEWKIINYSITYHPNNDTDIPAGAYNVSSSVTLPTPSERCGYRFDGWFDNSSFSGSSVNIFIPNANNLGNKNFYAKWVPNLSTPTANLLSYSIPSDLAYNGKSIEPIKVEPKSANLCELNKNITVLYNGQTAPPKDAGTHALSASIPGNQYYESATVALGNFTIAKANITLNATEVMPKNKNYDATTTAYIESIVLEGTSFFGDDKISESDTSIRANFSSPDVGEGISISGTVAWLPNGPLQKNYIINEVPFSTAANIIKTTGYLVIIIPEKYELSNPNPEKPTASKNSFIKDEDITWEYKRKSDEEYSKKLPNRTGDWQVRASFPETDNYSGAEAFATLAVIRGNFTTVWHKIEENPDFYMDSALSDEQKQLRYYVAEECSIKSINLQMKMREADIVLVLSNNARPFPTELGEDGGLFLYEFEWPLGNSGKPGLDTIIYTLLSTDLTHTEKDTLLIETPVPFDSIAGQKWNNVLYINNNSQTNGGYEFEKYEWFKNGTPVSEMQFYSAGPSSKDTLNSGDIYTVTMHTKDGMRVSTCKHNPETRSKTPSVAKSAFAKQVLGINGKTAKTGSEIYNLKGSKTENTPAGVYIVEE